MRLFVLFLAGCALFSIAGPACAQTAVAVVATKTIYPGETIAEDMVETAPLDAKLSSSAFSDRAKVIGKTARRTLLAGRAVTLDSISEPPVIANGAAVQIVYLHDGIEIVTSGQALNGAAPGGSVRVRNADSGLTVSGVATMDGKVRVGE